MTIAVEHCDSILVQLWEIFFFFFNILVTIQRKWEAEKDLKILQIFFSNLFKPENNMYELFILDPHIWTSTICMICEYILLANKAFKEFCIGNGRYTQEMKILTNTESDCGGLPFLINPTFVTWLLYLPAPLAWSSHWGSTSHPLKGTHRILQRRVWSLRFSQCDIALS